jgi:hypothetical protein
MKRNPRTQDSATDQEQSPDRAASYVIGFLLILSISVLSIFALLTVGFDLVSQADDNEAVSTGEETMGVVQSNLADLSTQRAATREMRVQMAHAQLGFGETSTIRLSANGQTFDLTGPNALEWETRELVYGLPDQETAFVYSFGHVIQTHEDPDSRSLPVHSPFVDLTENRLSVVAPVLEQDPSSIDQISVGTLTERELAAEIPSPLTDNTATIERTNRLSNGDSTDMTGEVAIEETTHPNAWEVTFDDIGFNNIQRVSLGSGEYRITGEFEVEQLVVQQADIQFTLES